MPIFEVYPKAFLEGSTWNLLVKVGDDNPQTASTPASVTSAAPIVLLKMIIRLDTGADPASEVFVALTVDDIRPGPQTETVWGNWVTTAESIAASLPPGFTGAEFRAAWTQGDTMAIRNDGRRALVSGPGGIGRGWTVLSIHQHEGDGTNTDE